MNADALALLGLTEYEMRVYRALLAEHPATAYRLGKRSGVPLSRVYEVAGRLVEKGAATTSGAEPALYHPVAPDEVVRGARLRAESALEGVGAELAALYSVAAGEGHAWLQGEPAVLARAASLASGARSEVLAAVSEQARGRLIRQLLVDDAVHVRVLGLPGSRRGDDVFTLVVDGATALIGRLGPRADALATAHPAIVRLCTDYFRLRTIADAAQEMVSLDRAARVTDPKGWIDWEEEKQRRLLHAH